jgi:hypothetical protein
MSTTTYLTEGILRHGLRVAVRPMQPGDRAELIAGFEHLSEQSRYRRFMTGKPRLSAGDIHQLLDTDELALVLVWPRTSCEDIVLGIAHAIRLPDQPSTAEFCIILTDEIQGQGAGRLLTRSLAREAAAADITHLTGYMLADNEAPARLLKGVGRTECDRLTQGTREITVSL